MAAAARGKAFVLMGGDCAETFAARRRQHPRAGQDDPADGRRAHLRRLAAGGQGRADGRAVRQAAQQPTIETRNGLTLPAYRGDMVNDFAFDPAVRGPDPQRLVRPTTRSSSATLNLVRAFTTGGFADLRHVHDWNKGFVRNSAANAALRGLAHDIDKAMKFMAAMRCGLRRDAHRVEFFAAHEALLLDYERPLTRIDSRTGPVRHVGALPVDRGAHPPARRRARGLRLHHAQPDRRQDRPKAEPDDVVRLSSASTRAGARAAHAHHPDGGRPRPRCAAADRAEGRRDAGCGGHLGVRPHARQHLRVPGRPQDPRLRRHRRRGAGLLRGAPRFGTVPGGLHVELTGNDVTECVGGTGGVLDADLATRYETACDPRLNHRQSLELAFLVAEMLVGRRHRLSRGRR
jgi:3-deoxy-7-phosphoheptulonate synthase